MFGSGSMYPCQFINIWKWSSVNLSRQYNYYRRANGSIEDFVKLSTCKQMPLLRRKGGCLYDGCVFVWKRHCRGESLTTGGATGEAVCGPGDGCYQVRVVHMLLAVVCYICLPPWECMCVWLCHCVCIKWISHNSMSWRADLGWYAGPTGQSWTLEVSASQAFAFGFSVTWHYCRRMPLLHPLSATA